MGLGWDRRHQFWLALLLLLPIVANAFVHPDVRCKQEPNTRMPLIIHNYIVVRITIELIIIVYIGTNYIQK